VKPVPLRLSAISLEHRIFDGREQRGPEKPYLNPSQGEYFRQELARFEQERSSSDTLSQLYLKSTENRFLYQVLLWKGQRLPDFQEFHSEFMEEALERTLDNLALAASVWEQFSNDFFRKQGRPIPDWPMYVEIQKDLGIYGTSQYHQLGRMLKKRAQERLKVTFDNLCRIFPGWTWAARKRCYLTAVFWNQYKLPSGKYSC
jgi:hypothetical protein